MHSVTILLFHPSAFYSKLIKQANIMVQRYQRSLGAEQLTETLSKRKKHHLKVLFKEIQFAAFFIFQMRKTRMQVKNDLRCLRQINCNQVICKV